jgi:hypothetical protein
MPSPDPGLSIVIPINAAARVELEAEAARRGTSVADLVALIVLGLAPTIRGFVRPAAPAIPGPLHPDRAKNGGSDSSSTSSS